MTAPTVIEFFAGSGLVTSGLGDLCRVMWANDISVKKAQVYCINHGSSEFELGDICDLKGGELPATDISWASFPCQDLSLAGKMAGIQAARSGMFWEWLRVLDEMPKKPKVLCLENVVGLVSVRGGENYRVLHRALEKRGYRVGPMLLDAVRWLPQSRKRVFVVAVQDDLDSRAYEDSAPNWAQPGAIQKACAGLKEVVWWKMPEPIGCVEGLDQLIEWDAPCFDTEKENRLMSLITDSHRERMEQKAQLCRRAVFPGYRRTRNGKQVLELRFDNISGCLRTAKGGSSKQFVVLWNKGKWSARLITVREAARIMGAPDSYRLADNYNDSYDAMGDAVAVPVVEFLGRNLLSLLPSCKSLPKYSSGDFVLNG